VPIAWAIPLEGRREEAGRFWAFFPTHTQTYLPGILNAPWKLNSDRNAIIGGEWNVALMVEAARLIAETLPDLATPEDPARSLDAFPRQLDRKDEDAAPLVESLWSALKTAAVIPDGSGALRPAQALWRHPKDTLDLTTAWQTLAGEQARRQLVHASCLKVQRASRLNALAERIDAPQAATGALRRCSTESWFKLVTSPDSGQAMPVLRLAKQFADACPAIEWNRHRSQLAIIPSESGSLVTATKAVLAPEGVTVPGRETVSSTIQADSDARRILTETLRVSELDDGVWETILAEALSTPTYPAETRWKAFWSRLRRAPVPVRKAFIETHSRQVRVCRRDGQWVRADHVLLPGGLVAATDTSRNQNVLVDEQTHGTDGASLRALGVMDVPQGIQKPAPYDEVSGESSALSSWREACRYHYKATHDNSASWSYLQPERLSMPYGYALLAELTGLANARFTSQLLDRLTEPVSQKEVRFGHSTMSVYPKMNVPHPLPWFVVSHGALRIGSSATARLAAVLARSDAAALRKLPEWTAVESRLGLLQKPFPDVTASPSALQALWRAAISVLAIEEAISRDDMTDLWSAAAEDGVIPAELPSSGGSLPLTAIFVTNSADLAQRARVQGRVVVTLDPTTMRRWLQAGAQDLAALIKPKWDDLNGAPERLTDIVPELADVLRTDARRTSRCQRVTRLRLLIGDLAQPASCLMWDGTLYLDVVQLAPLSRAKRLRRLLCEIAAAGWLDGTPEEALQRLGDAGVHERRNRVAQGKTTAERLLLAVGGRPGPLRGALGEPLCDLDFVGQCAPLQLAELVLAQLGPAALSALRGTLEEEGLKPPARWTRSAAIAFVASLGFPIEFASSAEGRREPEEIISGPIDLPPLHDFQHDVFAGLSKLLASGTTRRRAVVSLPTGGGKTRVVVEAAVRLVLAPEGVRRSVVWIAQTDELCEQAVQAFRQVWVNVGAKGADLRIVRLWGGNPNPAGQDSGKAVVVVASIQTLNNRFGAADLEWLRKPGLVVVDECHHAIAPSYSALLRWLDAEVPRPSVPEKQEPAIVGLSATPFRTDDDESQRLARRFDNRWLPPDQEQLYRRLRDQGVLAQPRYEPLDSGVGLTDAELERFGRLTEPWEGLDFENLLEAINQRLAGDARRNERLVECIRASRERTILFFANSVAHADEIAARLNLAAIPAAAISGSTPTMPRRYFLDRFQRGQVRVLCSHTVLTTGFDAPKTEMVLIARQVFSPVRYMQMVGRGLRGEKNGGTEMCRIVTVIDNLGRFEDRHPYHYCKELYAGGT
jgi:superfamily II DNA or RNA helicase